MSPMTASEPLLVVVADNRMRASIETLLRKRQGEIGIELSAFEVKRHPDSDPGCRLTTVEFVRSDLSDFGRLLVLFDYEGCGSTEPAGRIEKQIEDDLARNGWKGRSKVIVIVPELEAWIWGPSEGAARALGWGRGFPALRAWLAGEGLWPPVHAKPPDPKKAAERVLQRSGGKLVSRFFRGLAAAADFRDCRDPAFCALRDTLREWYPAEAEARKQS